MSKIEELENRIKELKKKKDELDALVNIQDVFQHSYKIYLNSVYGFTGTEYSPVLSTDLAEAVTSTGRATIQEMVKFTNAILVKIDQNGTGLTEYVVAGDTDSCAHNTEIVISESNKMAIGDFYNKLEEDLPIFKLTNGTELLDIHGWYHWNNVDNPYFTESLNGLTNIKNVSRHKVTKEKWKISIDNEDVEITKDHSVMVYRDGYIIECKPEEIKETDYLLKRKK